MVDLAKKRYAFLKWPKTKKVNLGKSLGEFIKVALTSHK